MNGDNDGGDGHGDDQVLKAWKRIKRKQKAQEKGIIVRSHFVLVVKTLRECDHI